MCVLGDGVNGGSFERGFVKKNDGVSIWHKLGRWWWGWGGCLWPA